MNQFKLAVVILSAIAFCEVLQSETMIAKIKKMNQTYMLVDMKNTQGFDIGDMVSNGNNCLLKVQNKSRTQLVLNTKSCQVKRFFQKGISIILENDQLNLDNNNSYANSYRSSESFNNMIQNHRSSQRNPASANQNYQQNNYRSSESFRHPSSNYTEKRKSFFGHIGKNAWGRYVLSCDACRTTRVTAKHELSFGFGYANISEYGSGYFARLTSSEYDEDEQVMRLEFNKTTALSSGSTPFFGIYGLGLIHFEGEDSDIKISKGGVSAQWGVGAKLNHNFGVELLALHSRFRVQIISGPEIDFWLHELRLGINFYF